MWLWVLVWVAVSVAVGGRVGVEGGLVERGWSKSRDVNMCMRVGTNSGPEFLSRPN